MERLLLLWDELDELVSYGWHVASTLAHKVSSRVTRTQATVAGSAPTGA
jgi:hypothetical protein